ncbi:hypothetical protein PG999_010235 [Apiospora kogelbergensis]|uniref:Uncharacterized protein n=1 Tax=Apiospora kogelbergensis TaxID=1337665 RepID=A0AAW0QKG1_9PEZI
MLSSEVIVALALGIPSLFVAAAALWVAYLTYAHSRDRESLSSTSAVRVPSWPSQYPLLAAADAWTGNGPPSPVIPHAAFPGSFRRRVNG